MAPNRILLVEDEPTIRIAVRDALRTQGHEVDDTVDGAEGLRRAKAGGYDLLLLDVMLPGLDGLEVLKALRRGGDHVPVILLTARGGEDDRVRGLALGADDYVAKPFRVAELLARVRAQLRRASGPEHELLHAGEITVDTSSRRVSVDGEEVSLTPKEYDLLIALMRRAGLVIPRDELMRDVWQTEWMGATKTLDMHISTLRRKLGDAGSRISTVRGVGFRLEKDA